MGESKDGGLFGNLSASGRKQGRRVLGVRADSDQRAEREGGGGGSAWEIYRLELGAVVKALSAEFPQLPGLIKAAVEAAHARGRKAVMSDVFGDGNGGSLGADATVNLALTGRTEPPPGHTTVEGNAYDNHVQGAYVKALDAEQGDLVFAMFNPWGGVRMASEPDKRVVAYSSVKLFQLFRAAYSRLATPGVMYVMLGSLSLDQRDAFLKHLTDQKIEFSPGGSSSGGILITKGAGFAQF